VTNRERLDKLKKAKSLIREVESSYPLGHQTRFDLYSLLVGTHGDRSAVAHVIKRIREEMDRNGEGNSESD